MSSVRSTGNPPGRPGRPVAVKVEGTSVTLDWSAPGDKGGLVITGYIIKYGVDGSDPEQYDTEHVDQVTTSYRFSGKLKAKTSYQFAVAAVNKAGERLFSDFSGCIVTNSGN